MTQDAKREYISGPIDLSEQYRPVGIEAVRAAYRVLPGNKPASVKEDAPARFLLPEFTPD